MMGLFSRRLQSRHKAAQSVIKILVGRTDELEADLARMTADRDNWQREADDRLRASVDLAERVKSLEADLARLTLWREEERAKILRQRGQLTGLQDTCRKQRATIKEFKRRAANALRGGDRDLEQLAACNLRIEHQRAEIKRLRALLEARALLDAPGTPEYIDRVRAAMMLVLDHIEVHGIPQEGESAAWIAYTSAERKTQEWLATLPGLPAYVTDHHKQAFKAMLRAVLTGEMPEMYFGRSDPFKAGAVDPGDGAPEHHQDGMQVAPDPVAASVPGGMYGEFTPITVQGHSLPLPVPAPDPVEEAAPAPVLLRVQHVKRGGTYRVLGLAKVQTDTPLNDYAEVMVYQSEEDGLVWVRPVSEFEDGRFRALSMEGAP